MSSKFRSLGDCLLVRIAWRSCTRSVSNCLIVLPHEDYRGKPGLSDASLDPRSLWLPFRRVQGPLYGTKFLAMWKCYYINIPTVLSSWKVGDWLQISKSKLQSICKSIHRPVWRWATQLYTDTSQGSLLSMLTSRTSVHCSGRGALCMIRTWFAARLSPEPPDASEPMDPLPDIVSTSI